MTLTRDIAYGVGVAVSSPIWGLNLLRTGKWRTDWPGRFGRAPTSPDGRPTMLFCAVSVGEVNLVKGLIDHLAAERPDLRVVIAVTTNTGFDRAVKLYGERYAVVRYPLDFGFAVRRFLDAVRPDLVALVELEVWPNFVETVAARGARVCVINGRLSDRSIGRYRRIRAVLRSTFAALDAVAAQDRRYADRFVEMGVAAERVHVLDTMKWDAADPDESVPGAEELAGLMGIDRARPVVVLGSTGPGEEASLLDALERRLDRQVQYVVVPRKPERFEAVAQLLGDPVRRSRPGAGQRGRFLIDTMGDLRKAYALADAVIVGRSFNGWGGSDPIEPIAIGRPTVIGPDHHNFTDVVAALRAGDGIAVNATPAEAAGTVERWLTRPRDAAASARRGREVILARRGATERHADLLLALLERGKSQVGGDGEAAGEQRDAGTTGQ